MPPWPIEDLEDDVPPAPAAANASPLLERLTVRCHSRQTPMIHRFRCSAPGCDMSWTLPRQSSRVLKHASHECMFIDEQLKQLVGAVIAGKRG
ncbi:hypothetical protein FB45DRAFT_955037 [Roridomyces roridus]|uniref:Uncharacterized protein n=1 Tax=Roridomyces roridus TaxID=1738132 RepID=A0AAD7AZ70_9AGAR|nr:hypothetical protein FB45DRAFT_955037 [Roridomyces roridus]